MTKVNPIGVLEKFYKEHKDQSCIIYKASTYSGRYLCGDDPAIQAYPGIIVGYNKSLNVVIILADTPYSWNTLHKQGNGDYIKHTYHSLSNKFRYCSIEHISFT